KNPDSPCSLYEWEAQPLLCWSSKARCGVLPGCFRYWLSVISWGAFSLLAFPLLLFDGRPGWSW
ncbi:hypothetical protein A2U01_0082009, partial [Trifolium medium]|nr:hypothetical protein [Trifolium medium]